jgi:hypothetical protein
MDKPLKNARRRLSRHVYGQIQTPQVFNYCCVTRWKILIFVEEPEPLPLSNRVDIAFRRPSHDEQRPQPEALAHFDLRIHLGSRYVGPGILNLDTPGDAIALKDPIQLVFTLRPGSPAMRSNVRSDDSEARSRRRKAE